MPSAADTFGEIAGAQSKGPFSAYLNPIQQQQQIPEMPQATGWEAHPHAVAGADIALGFLRGVRQNRLAQAAQEDQNTESQMNAYRNQVSMMLQNPELTDAAKQQIYQQAQSVMAQHAQYEVRDVPKDGIGGFFKNLLIHATGGPIKVRQPIDFQSETGAIAHMADASTAPQNLKSYWRGEANKQLAAATASMGPSASAPQVQRAAAQIAQSMDLQSHLGQDGAGQWIASAGGIAPTDPVQEALQRMEMQRLQQLGGSTAAPPAPPQGAQPAVNPPALPSMGGQQSLTQGMPATAPPPSAAVRPADTGAPPVTAAPPTMDLRNPVDRQLLTRMGYKIGEATTVYNPANLEQWHANVIRDPVSGQWLEESTMQPIPAQEQGFVPHDQLKMPAVAQEAFVSASLTPSGPRQIFRVNRRTGVPEPVTKDGQPLYGVIGLDEVAGPNGSVIRVPSSQAVGQPVPLPRQTAAVAEKDARDRAAEDLAGEAERVYPGDIERQSDYIDRKEGVPDGVRSLAKKGLHEAASKDLLKDEFNRLIPKPSGQGPAASATIAPSVAPAKKRTAAPPKKETGSPPALTPAQKVTNLRKNRPNNQ